MAMALFADDDYEEVLTRLAEPLAQWGRWDTAWETPGSSGITQARQRIGPEPLQRIFEEVCRPVAEEETRGAWLGGWRLVSVDGFEWDAPDTPANAKAFGYGGGKQHPSAFPTVRVLTLVESASHAVFGAAIAASGGKGTGERSLARDLLPLLDETMLLLADRGFYSFEGWCQAADTDAALLWQVGENLQLPLVADRSDGSCTSVVFASRVRASERERILADARAGRQIDPGRAGSCGSWGYLLTHHAISALVCEAATAADLDPDRVKFLRTVRLVRRRIADPAAVSP